MSWAFPPNERGRLLNGLADLGATQFDGRVTRNWRPPIYIARRD
ncbi:MAG: hypothetical protein ABIQ30_11970 [Devosia sp.]